MIIFHGDNESSSRQALAELKSKLTSQGYELHSVNPDVVAQMNIPTNSLFSTQQAVVVENLLSKRLNSDKTELAKYLSQLDSIEIILWEHKDVTPSLKIFPTAKIYKFNLPKSIFEFLENFTLTKLEQALKTSPPDLVLNLWATQIHRLLLCHYGSSTALPAWQQAKIHSQLKSVSLAKLIKLHTLLLNLDYSYKTGLLPGQLGPALVQTLISV
jgi:hypothetical protein